jgi:hypothetical protein
MMKEVLSFVRLAASPRTCDVQRYAVEILNRPFYSQSDFKEGRSATCQRVSTENDASNN